MSIQRRNWSGVAVPLLAAASLVGGAACSSSHGSAPPPATPPAAQSAPAPQANSAPGQQPQPSRGNPSGQGPEPETGPGNRDAELVVSHEIVARCPSLKLVKEHVDQFDPNTVWLAVLESIGECMSEGGPLATRNLGVSGDEQHRHVVREVLGSRGVASTRVVATQPRVGAAECQGGVDCTNRVELTLISQ